MFQLAITSGIFSSFIYLYVLFKKNIPLFSSYGIFGLFNTIYWIFPALTVAGIYPEFYFRSYELSSNTNLISIYLLILSASVFIFCMPFLNEPSRSFCKTTSIKTIINRGASPIGPIYFSFYASFALVLIYFGFKYPYGKSVRPELVHSIISLGKVLLASFFIFALISRPKKIYTVLMLIFFAVLTIIEGSRWYFLTVLVTSACFIENNSSRSIIPVLAAGLFFVIFLSIVGLLRVGVDIDNALLLFSPFYIEGDQGSYSAVQTLSLILDGNIQFVTLFSDYIVDPILYEIPRPLFIAAGGLKDDIGILPLFRDNHQQYLSEQFAPDGGFLYISQGLSAFPIVGPLIISFFYAKICIKFERIKNKSFLFELLYYCFIGGIAFVFVKTIFAQTIKYFITLALPVFFIYFTRKLFIAKFSKHHELAL